jgi:hypothetical protein
MTDTPPPPPAAADCTVIELRQYSLHPGQRELLIELFDRELVETQEACGMKVMGQFRDLDRPDRFVWLRGFAGMEARRRALQAFYGGPVWAAHSGVANATMKEFDDVLLLRPAWAGAGIPLNEPRPRPGAAQPSAGLLDATVFHLREVPGDALLRLARQTLAPVLAEGGASAVGWYVTEASPNTFPRLPVRDKVQVLLGLALFPDAAAFDRFVAAGSWGRDAAPALQPYLAAPPEPLRLAPTARSAIRS